MLEKQCTHWGRMILCFQTMSKRRTSQNQTLSHVPSRSNVSPIQWLSRGRKAQLCLFFWSENTGLWLVSIFCLFEMSFSMKVIYIFIISAYAVAHGVSAFLRIVCWIGTALALRRASPRLDAPFRSVCCEWCGPLSSKQGGTVGSRGWENLHTVTAYRFPLSGD